MDMPVPHATKYVYRIRCSNGALVEHLQIYGETESHARERLMQMYHHCEVLEVVVAAATSRQLSTEFVDVLSSIVNVE